MFKSKTKIRSTGPGGVLWAVAALWAFASVLGVIGSRHCRWSRGHPAAAAIINNYLYYYYYFSYTNEMRTRTFAGRGAQNVCQMCVRTSISKGIYIYIYICFSLFQIEKNRGRPTQLRRRCISVIIMRTCLPMIAIAVSGDGNDKTRVHINIYARHRCIITNFDA